MSLASTSSSFEQPTRDSSIDKIWEQGHRLRKAMVQSILNHDPFNTDVINVSSTSGFVKSRLRKRIPLLYSNLNDDSLEMSNEKLKAFLKGDSMNRKDEIEVCETLKSMSEDDLCRTTNLVYNLPNYNCSCTTCLRYAKEDFNCDLMRTNEKNCCKMYGEGRNQQQDGITPQVQFNAELNEYMKYVDCIRVTVQDLVLNEKGNKKVTSSLRIDKKIPVWGSQTFFIEYELPFILSVSTHKKNIRKMKNTIHNNNFVRICARRLSTEAIVFKQSSVHNIENVDHINFQGIQMKFQISCRAMKQKNSTLVGFAVFNFDRFDSSSNLTCIEELHVNFNDNVPIVLGNLRILVEMGYGRLYFGREFIASFRRSPESISSQENKTLQHQLNKTYSEHLKHDSSQEIQKKKISVSKLKNEIKNKHIEIDDSLNRKFIKKKGDDISFNTSNVLNTDIFPLQTAITEKHILFGFLYVPEAQYSKTNITSFITCKLFGQEDVCYSKLIVNESHPIFNFCQLMPIVYHNDFLQQLRDNVMVIEFWEKFETKNILFGLTKLPLHQFYLAYRNVDVTRYLAHNKLPIITADWWESVTNPYTDELVGQVQVLLALGTEQQIRNLELERGFKVNTVRANFEAPLKKNIYISNKKQVGLAPTKKYKGKLTHPKLAEEVNFKGDFRLARLNEKCEKTVLTTKDKGVQSDVKMNSEDMFKEKEIASNEKLSQLLNQIITIQTQRSSMVETGTNTDNGCNELNANHMESKEKKTAQHFDISDTLLPTTSAKDLEMEQTSFSSSKLYENAPPIVRSTSDLLHSLQAALSIPPAKRPLISANRAVTHDSNQEPISSKNLRTSFKAQIFIKQALHLPIRKRYRGKKCKGKVGKGDDNVKPSCYVTFETMPGLDLKMTTLVPKSTSPSWNYKCDVFLPAELLFNNQKRLIFKVWRKSTNTTMTPNLQSDLVLGFATIDLTVLLSGFPNVQGWFNIIDFSSKCNGQINLPIITSDWWESVTNPYTDELVGQVQVLLALGTEQQIRNLELVHVTPLEDLSIFRVYKGTQTCSLSPVSNEANDDTQEVKVQKQYQQINQEFDQEPESELLSRALKRKFTELDEITQRLRLRLSYVTKDESDEENDEIADDFERDINSLSIEDDFDMANFEKESPNVDSPQYSLLGIDCSGASSSCDTVNSPGRLNSNSIASLMIVPTHEEVTKEFEHTQESLSILDRQLLEGKQRIDTLLGKLSLISGDANSFSSRYISGCSATNRSEPGGNDIDTEAILKDLDNHSRPNILASTSFDTTMFERIYDVAEKKNASSTSSSSGTSVISNTAGLRAAPDGQGTFSGERDK